MLLVMLVRHVTTLPPGFPVPLHWLTVIGIAGLTLDATPTEQATVAPPPFAEPLHWVTVAPVVVAGKGLQFTVPPPPPPEPTHWLTVAAVTGCAPAASALMLFVMVTSQVIGCAASLSELLHWRTTVTRLVELVVNVPFGDEQGPRAHCRVTVVVELVVVPLTVLTTVTVHFIPVVAPSALEPWPLHWSMAMGAALAGPAGTIKPASENALRTATKLSRIVRRVNRRGKPTTWDVPIVRIKQQFNSNFDQKYYNRNNPLSVRVTLLTPRERRGLARAPRPSPPPTDPPPGRSV